MVNLIVRELNQDVWTGRVCKSATLPDCCADAIQIPTEYRVEVKFNFEGVPMRAKEGSTVDLMMAEHDQYQISLKDQFIKMSDLSEIDRGTLEIRGESGAFKPEDTAEKAISAKALEAGATRILDWWLIENYPRAVEFRESCAKYQLEIPRDRQRG